jgi:hypothetical protein
MPQWLKTVLLAVGLLILAVLVAGLVLLARRRRQQAAARAVRPGAAGSGPAAGRPGSGKAHIVVAGHDRLVVTWSPPDDTVYVLRPPGADPREILRVARLVLPEDLYRELAVQLGMPAGWPIVVADHDRLVVTWSPPDDTVYVLRPPGADPREILRVARLVLPEVPYGELAVQLGVPASWPMEYRVPAKSACAGLAWSILTVIVVAIGMTGLARPAQANIRIASSTTQVTLASTLGAAAAPGPAARPAARYVVQPGDTLSGIAARLAVRGGWPALYAANRPRIGPDPDVIRPGTVLVLPGRRAPARYTVVSGDTLAGIAAALAVRGGWPALYAANRRVIGPDPDVIRPGAVLTVPRAAPSPAASVPAPRGYPAPPPSAPAGSGHGHLPGRTGAPAAAGMPQWLKTVLLAVGLVTGAAFVAGPVLAVRRRRQQAPARTARSGNAGVSIRCGRGGRSRSVAGAVRPVVAAARVHPAGVAVPGVVLAAGIVLFTFVESVTMRAGPPPGGSGPGPVSAARPGAGQPHHRLQPRQPGPPGQPALPGSPGRNARSLACGLEQMAPPLPVLAEVPPAGPGRVPRASRNPSSSLPGGGLACDVTRVPSSAATAAAGSRGADQ